MWFCSFLSCVVCAAAACISVAWAEGAANTARRTLAKSEGSVPRVCNAPNCAVVLAVRHSDLNESPPPIAVQGSLKRDPPLGPYNPHVPPVTQPSFMVQKHKDVWVIQVRRLNGEVQSIEQSYPVLFQAGDWVLVEGDHVRAPE